MIKVAAGTVAIGVVLFCLAYWALEMVVDTVSWVVGNG